MQGIRKVAMPLREGTVVRASRAPVDASGRADVHDPGQVLDLADKGRTGAAALLLGKDENCAYPGFARPLPRGASGSLPAIGVMRRTAPLPGTLPANAAYAENGGETRQMDHRFASSSSVGTALRSARLAKGMTQSQLGSAMGLSKSQISRWETGDRIPQPLSVMRLSTVLDVSLERATSELDQQTARSDVPSLGATIKNLRLARALSAARLARLLSVSPAAVSKWETSASAPRRRHIDALKDVLGVDLDLLFREGRC